MIDIKDYLEQTNTVLLTKDAFEYLKERVSVLDKIRAEIDRLHYHPKLDYIKNDEVVEMALEIIDRHR